MNLTPEQITLIINAFSNAPTQGVLWFAMFFGVRQALILAKERIAWLQTRLDRYMDRDTEIVSSVAKLNVEIAGKYTQIKP